MSECEYCHNMPGTTHGKYMRFQTNYYDYKRKTKVAQKKSALIISPELKHPKISISRTDKFGDFIKVIDFPINYCPKCGRKLVNNGNC